jgi:hypothetical protein
LLSSYWANDDGVRKALHTRKVQDFDLKIENIGTHKKQRRNEELGFAGKHRGMGTLQVWITIYTGCSKQF